MTAQVAVLGGLVALGPLATDAYVPGLPLIAHDLTASASAVQLTVTTVLVGLSLGQLVAGPLSDAYGRRRLTLIGVVGYSLASLLAAIAPTVVLLTAVRAVQGIAGATVLVVAYATLGDLFDGPALARRFASLMLITGLAPVLAPLAGAAVIHLAGWRAVFVGLSVVAALLAIAVWWLSPESLPPTGRRRSGVRTGAAQYRQLLSDRAVLVPTAVSAFVFAAMFAYIAASPFVLQDMYGMSTSGYGVVFAVNAAGLVLSAQIGGRLVARCGGTKVVGCGVLGAGCGGIGSLLASITDSEPMLLVALFVLVSSVGVVMPSAAALVIDGRGDDSGSRAALLGSGQFLFGGLVGPLMAVTGRTSGITMSLSILGCCVLAAVVLVGEALLNRR